MKVKPRKKQARLKGECASVLKPNELLECAKDKV
jgi:hypothetical protein